MLKLARYLKPWLGLVALTIALLFAQANADLALPDLMSRIINVGIQQGGVDSPFPRAIRKDTLDNALFLMPDADREAVLAAYSLEEPGSEGHTALLATYPAAKEWPLYRLTGKPPAAQGSALETSMARALAGLTAVEKAFASGAGPGMAMGLPSMAQGNAPQSMAAQASGDAPAATPPSDQPSASAATGEALAAQPSPATPGLPGTAPGTPIPPAMPGAMAAAQSRDPFSLLRSLPAERSAPILASIREKLDAIDPVMARQAAISVVRTEYETLGADTARLQISSILVNGGWMLLLTLGSVVATILVGFLSARVAAGLARDLRREIFTRVERFSLAELDRFSTASLITRTTNDITQLQQVSMFLLRMVFYAPIMGIGGVVRAMGKASGMWWIIALAVTVLLSVIISVFVIAVPKFKSIQKLVDRLNLVVRENLSGMMVIRAFGRQAQEEKRFDEANKKLTGTMLFVTRIMVIMMPLMMLIMNLVSILILWVGAHEIDTSALSVGDMMAFMQYSMQIFFSFIMMSMMFIMLPRASVSAERIAEVLAVEPAIVDKPDPVRLPQPVRGEVRFDAVSFRYHGADEDVLHDISFTAKPGQTTAIIGTTGAGKSTLVSLILRLYDSSSGSISIDGVNVKDLSQKELRDTIGFVPQKSVLFSGTVESNLLYARPDATPQEMEKALEIAQALDFVKEKDTGEGVAIAQGGSNVSGGQRQRLAIARALVKRAPITIFDDSFSALDYATDTRLRRALAKDLGDSSIIVVTQRVATIKRADLILVLDEGRLVGKGTHHELLEGCEVYRDIALSQLKQEELA